jgi:hypothetical protein
VESQLVDAFVRHAHDDAFFFDRLYRRFERLADQCVTALIRQAATDQLLPMSDAELDVLPTVETLLTTYGRISLLFFPDTKAQQAVARGVALRTALNLPDDHPIKNRRLRNHWMHLDDRLDKHIKNRGAPPYFFIINEQKNIDAESMANTLRVVDPRAEEVYFLGERFELKQLRQDVNGVYARADRFLLGDPQLP